VPQDSRSNDRNAAFCDKEAVSAAAAAAAASVYIATVPELVHFLPQNNILLPSFWPCHCRGYVAHKSPPLSESSSCLQSKVHVTKSMTVHALLGLLSSAEKQLLGDQEEPPLASSSMDEVGLNHNPETLRELTLRLQMMWDRTILIGNTADALSH
jgi:hypothetical protein